MIKRFRLIAGPNGSGKSTLMRQLATDYAVNFYDVLNADDIFAEVSRSGCYQPHFCFDSRRLISYVDRSLYAPEVKACFVNGEIVINEDCVHFRSRTAINTYTIALLTNFLQNESINQGRSFSQETVFSHPSKIEALRVAKAVGYRTYLYFVATDTPLINLARVALRAKQGGHDVPAGKIKSRFERSLAQLPLAFEHLSRAFFFDNSGETMRYLAHWNPDEGLVKTDDGIPFPKWARSLCVEGNSRVAPAEILTGGERG